MTVDVLKAIPDSESSDAGGTQETTSGGPKETSYLQDKIVMKVYNKMNAGSQDDRLVLYRPRDIF